MRRCRLHVGRPWEAYPSKNVYVRISDIDDDQVFDGLMYSILAGYVSMFILDAPVRHGVPLPE